MPYTNLSQHASPLFSVEGLPSSLRHLSDWFHCNPETKAPLVLWTDPAQRTTADAAAAANAGSPVALGFALSPAAGVTIIDFDSVASYSDGVLDHWHSGAQSLIDSLMVSGCYMSWSLSGNLHSVVRATGIPDGNSIKLGVCSVCGTDHRRPDGKKLAAIEWWSGDVNRLVCLTGKVFSGIPSLEPQSAPANVLHWMQTQRSAALAAPVVSDVPDLSAFTDNEIDELIARSEPVVDANPIEGDRSEWLCTIAQALIDSGMTREQTLAAMIYHETVHEVAHEKAGHRSGGTETFLWRHAIGNRVPREQYQLQRAQELFGNVVLPSPVVDFAGEITTSANNLEGVFGFGKFQVVHVIGGKQPFIFVTKPDYHGERSISCAAYMSMFQLTRAAFNNLINGVGARDATECITTVSTVIDSPKMYPHWGVVRRGTAPHFNTFDPFPIKPCEGEGAGTLSSIETLYRWLTKAIPNPHQLEWLLDWWAYRVQNPNKKMQVHPAFIGESRAGKSQLAALMMSIYRSRYASSDKSTRTLLETHTGWRVNKLLIQFDEFNLSSIRKPEDRDNCREALKALLSSGGTTTARLMGKDHVEVDDVAACVFTSNHLHGFDFHGLSDPMLARLGVIKVVNPMMPRGKPSQDQVLEAQQSWGCEVAMSVIGVRDNDSEKAKLLSFLLARDVRHFQPNTAMYEGGRDTAAAAVEASADLNPMRAACEEASELLFNNPAVNFVTCEQRNRLISACLPDHEHIRSEKAATGEWRLAAPDSVKVKLSHRSNLTVYTTATDWTVGGNYHSLEIGNLTKGMQSVSGDYDDFIVSSIEAAERFITTEVANRINGRHFSGFM